MVKSLRSKWAAGKGNVSADWRIGVRGTKTVLSDTAILSKRSPRN